MKSIVILLTSLFLFQSCDKLDSPKVESPESTNELYFPAISGDEWKTTSLDSLEWKEDNLEELLSLLENAGTRAFMVLKDGKIVIEEYWGKTFLGTEFNRNSNWYWASAGKTLTSFLVGQAQEDGFLEINNSSSDYLGSGWTSLAKEEEDKITVLNQLTMTSGLDDSKNVDCTDPECLTYKADPNTRWAYHNAPYTILDKVVENATKKTFNDYFNEKLRDPIGMDGFWQYLDYNHVYFSTARSMARFGLMVMNNGYWDKTPILEDEDYLKNSVNSSQEMNPSYGYLWWLNGQEKIQYPGFQLVINQKLTENAPDDMYAAMGKNGQYLNIVPSQNLIMIRMGENPNNALVPVEFQNDIWEKLNNIIVD